MGGERHPPFAGRSAAPAAIYRDGRGLRRLDVVLFCSVIDIFVTTSGRRLPFFLFLDLSDETFRRQQ